MREIVDVGDDLEITARNGMRWGIGASPPAKANSGPPSPPREADSTAHDRRLLGRLLAAGVPLQLGRPASARPNSRCSKRQRAGKDRHASL